MDAHADRSPPGSATFSAWLSGLRSVGLTVDDAKREMLHREASARRSGKRDATNFVPDRTLRRYIAEGAFPLAKRSDTVGHIAVLADLTADPDAVMRVYQMELLQSQVPLAHSWAQEHEAAASSGFRFPRVWFGMIQPQGERAYSSLDEITFSSVDENDMAGFIRRIQPSRERNLFWRFSGTRNGMKGLYLAFWPVEGDPESRGVIVMKRSNQRPLSYSGFYVRPSPWPEDDGHVQRPYLWSQSPHQSALENVALVDVDGTLRRGWTIFGWVQFLADGGHPGASELLDELQVLKRQYADGGISHDELADGCAVRYAKLESGLNRIDLRSEARVFAQQSLATDFFDFARPLLETIRAESVAPILVTGAPAVVAAEYARLLEVEEYYALECEAGEVRRNRGLAAEKRRVCSDLAGLGRTVVAAVGDSTSDRSMLATASIRVIVGTTLEAPEEWEGDNLRRIDADVDGAELSDWIADRLDLVI